MKSLHKAQQSRISSKKSCLFYLSPLWLELLAFLSSSFILTRPTLQVVPNRNPKAFVPAWLTQILKRPQLTIYPLQGYHKQETATNLKELSTAWNMSFGLWWGWELYWQKQAYLYPTNNVYNLALHVEQEWHVASPDGETVQPIRVISRNQKAMQVRLFYFDIVLPEIVLYVLLLTFLDVAVISLFPASACWKVAPSCASK